MSVHVRMTEDQRDEVRKMAKDNGLTVASVIREAIVSFVSDYREGASSFRSPKPPSRV